jgi:hypothetical protein
MKNFSFILILVITIVFSVSNYSQTSNNQMYVRRPNLTIEEALRIGKNYIKQQKIDVSRHYIDSIRLDLNPRGDRGKFWELRWEKNENGGKGDYILLHIYMDKQVERLFAK